MPSSKKISPKTMTQKMRPMRGANNDSNLAKEESFKSRYNLQGQHEGGGSRSNGQKYKTKFVLDPQKSGKLVPLAKTTVTDRKGKTKVSYGATVRRAETNAGVVPSLKKK
jgi:hypothetical protein